MQTKVQNEGFTFICTDCGKMERIEVIEHLPLLPVDCKICGKTTVVSLCFRKHFRKQAKIYGELNSKNSIQPIIIEDMSLMGYKIKYIGINAYIPNEGHRLIITYGLPNKKQTPIRETIEIVSNHGDNVFGVKVVDLPEFSVQQRDKGFWLMP